MSASIRVEFCAGSVIEGAVSEAISLASRIGVGIDFNFNGVELWVDPRSNPEEVTARYHEIMKIQSREARLASRPWWRKLWDGWRLGREEVQ